MEDEQVADLDRDGLLEEITHLNEVNRQLKTELAVLKQQYDEAINFTLKIEEFTEENKNLKKQISESRLIIDDLRRRLQISQQTNLELSNIKEKVKENADKAHLNEVNDLKLQLDIAKSENLNMNKRFQDQIKTLESSFFKAQSESALYKKQLDKVMSVVGNCFNEKFENPQDLCQKVSFATQQVQKQNSDLKLTTYDDEFKEEIQKKLISMKRQYQNEKDKRKELQMVVLKFKKKVEQDNLSYEEQVTQLKDTINQQVNEIHRLELLNQQKNLTQSNNLPTSSYHSVSCQTGVRESIDRTETLGMDIESYKRQVNNSNVQIEALETNSSMLKMKIDTLIHQVEEAENAKALINNKFKQTQLKFNELEKELKLSKSENQMQSIKINELQNQLNHNISSAIIPTKQLESKVKIMETTIESKNNALKNFEKLLSDQTNELSELSSVKDRLLFVIEKQNHMLNVYNEIFNKQEREAANIAKSLKMYKNDRHGEIDDEKIVVVEPKFKWPIEKLPKDIFEIVKDITENDSMSIQSRIKNVFIVINKWIEQCSNNNIKEQKKINDKLLSVSQSYDDFKWSIIEFIKAEIINESDDTDFESDTENCEETDEYDEFEYKAKSDKKETIRNKMKERKNKIINMKSSDENQKENEELIKNYLSYIMNKNRVTSKKLKEFQDNLSYLLKSSESVNIENVIEKQENLTKDNKLLIQKLEEEKKKRVSMRKKYRVIITEQVKESNEQISILQKAKENSRQQIEQLQESIKKFQDQNQLLLSQIKEQQNQINSTHQKVRKDKKIKKIDFINSNDNNNDINNDNFINNNINNNQSVSNNKSQSIFEYEDLQYSLENAEKSCNLWKETARKANDEKSNLQNRIQKIMNEYESQISHLNKKHEIEQSQNQKTIFELSQKLKTQSEDNEIAIKNLHTSLDKIQKLYDDSVQEIVQLKNEKEKLLHSSAANIESIERSKRLSEAQLKAKLLSLDANYSAVVDAEKQKSEKEKRELIEYFLNSFRKFRLKQANSIKDYDEKINEDYFKHYVRMVKDEFEKHQKTDEAIRKLIKANNEDPLEDALTQFIIQNHPQFQNN